MTTGDPVSRVAGDRPTLHTLVIIPTYNERENLPLILRRLHDALPEVHVLVVDDNSPDGTGQLAEELASADPDRIHVMHRTVKDGLGAAYLAGFAWGLSRQYTTLVEMDADGSHAPEQLHLLLEAVDAGADLVIGSRYVEGGDVQNWPWRALGVVLDGQHLRAAGPGHRHPRHHRRLPRLPARRSAEDRPRPRRFEGLLLPDRPDLARHHQRVRCRRGPDHLHRA